MYPLANIHSYVYSYDTDERAILETMLHRAGLHVYPESTLENILTLWSNQPAGLLIAALSECNNVTETVAQIRQVTVVPLILIMAPVDEDTQVALYTAGADLVLLRPYSLRLLLAQARNLAQRGNSIPLNQLPTLQIGNLQIDPATREVSVGDGGKPTPLTQREFQLFYLLYTHTGQTLTFDQIIEAIWGYTGQGDKNLLRSLIHRLRVKFEGDGETSFYIQSIPGVGYRFLGDFQL